MAPTSTPTARPRAWRARAVGAGTAALVAAGAAVTAGVPQPAQAATAAAWADWTVQGVGGAFGGTAAVAASGFPAASWTSDSRAPVGVPTGASTWLPAAGPAGQVYGSSQGRRYLQLRPAADTPGAPSTTVLAFDTPTPSGGWAVVLGDVDADLVTVSGTGADGLPVTAAQLGVQGSFNACDASPRAPSCAGLGAPFDLPSWSLGEGTATLTGGGADTDGASGWLQPQVPLARLTLQVEQQRGFPVVNVWLVALTRAATGSVTLDGVPSPGQTVQVESPEEQVVATALTDEAGAWSVPALVADDGWRARLVVPPGTEADGPTSLGVDLSVGDATGLDFSLRTPAPGPSTDPSVGPSPPPSGQPTGGPSTGPSAEPSVSPGTPTPTGPPGPGPDPVEPGPGTEAPDPGATPTVTAPTAATPTAATREAVPPRPTRSTGRAATTAGGALARTGPDGVLEAAVLGLTLVVAGSIALGVRRRP